MVKNVSNVELLSWTIFIVQPLHDPVGGDRLAITREDLE
jgi:hypothetical protein